MEERVARIESTVEHMLCDLKDIKADVRRVDAKIDSLKDNVDGLGRNLQAQITELAKHSQAQVTGLEKEMQAGFAELKLARITDRVWWLLISGAMLGVMARGFHWL